MDEKNPLFETETVCSWEEYLRYNKAVSLNKQRRVQWIVAAAISAVYVVGGAFAAYYCQTWRIFFITLIMPAFFAVWLPFTGWLARHKLRKIWESSAKKDEQVSLRFYESFVEGCSAIGETRLDYEKIHKIVETPTHFYIMLSQIEGFIVPKASLTEQQAAFLREKAPQTKKNKKKAQKR